MSKAKTKVRQRTIQFKLMLTPAEKEAWTALAQTAGLDISELVRRRMTGCRIKTVPEANWQANWQLGKIGNNINQIAKAQNTAIADGLTPPNIDLTPFEELRRQIDRLRMYLILGMDDDSSNSAAEGTDDRED